MGVNKHSAGKALAATATRLASDEANILYLGSAKLSPKLRRFTDDKGNPALQALFPESASVGKTIDLSFLLTLPKLWEPLAEGVVRACANNAHVTRVHFCGQLRTGFYKWLHEFHPGAALCDLNRETLWAYRQWQDAQIARSSGKRIKTGTADAACKTGHKIISSLEGHPVWGKEVVAVIAAYPTYRQGRGSDSTPRTPLSPDVLTELIQASEEELRKIEDRFDEGDRLLTEGNKYLANGSVDFNHLPVALAALVNRYPNAFPQGKLIMRECLPLGRAVYQQTGDRKSLGLMKLARYRYASARDLVPFVVLLTVEAGFNVDSVLRLKWTDIRPGTVLGKKTIRFDAPKGRARGGRYIKNLPESLVKPWLDLLQRITQPLRASLSDADKDRVFVFGPETSKLRAKSFSHNQSGPSGDSAWKNGLAIFLEQNKIPKLTLSQIRPGLVDQIAQVHGSIVASRAAGHARFQTTEGHYLGPGTREREQERLGTTLLLMERWVRSKGKIDPRQYIQLNKHPKGSCTPGWGCLDPFDSPIIGQRKQKLCNAFGQCPSCPNAIALNPSDPLVIAYWIALLKCIDEARYHLDPQQWASQWSGVASLLIRLVDSVDEGLMSEARSLNVLLPSVG